MKLFKRPSPVFFRIEKAAPILCITESVLISPLEEEYSRRSLLVLIGSVTSVSFSCKSLEKGDGMD
jgi:hypothetical protein